MRRKSIPAAAPVLMSSAIERGISIDTCLRTDMLYMDGEVNMMLEPHVVDVIRGPPVQVIKEVTNESVFAVDVPSTFLFYRISLLKPN